MVRIALCLAGSFFVNVSPVQWSVALDFPGHFNSLYQVLY